MNESLRVLTQKIPKLPTIPPVADKLIQLINSNAAFVSSVVETIEKDPAISAKVIGFSNAAFYRMGGPVTTVRDAVMKIGFDNIKGIALGISLLTIFRARKNSDSCEYENIIRHSMAVGAISKDIVDSMACREHEEVFTGGLLHDIGLLVMNSFFPDIFKKIVDGLKGGKSFAEAEKEVCGVSHGEIGAWLADKWNLPEDICEVIRCHHSPPCEGRTAAVAAIVNLADNLALRRNFSPISKKGFEAPIDRAAMKVIGMTEDKIREIESRVDGIVGPMQGMWS